MKPAVLTSPSHHWRIHRNVLIYMNEDVQRVVLERVLSALAPGGYLLLGAVERLPRSFPKLSPLLIEDHVVYRAAN
jgi:chemotaxis methyl-accepting protein methylase